MWFAPLLEALTTAVVAAVVGILREKMSKKKKASPKEKLPPCTKRAQNRHSRHKRNSSG
jgi:hypothetical protein